MAPPQWAYQVENFVNEPDEELICSICRSVFCDPVMCPCDHVFCQVCITKWVQNSRNCPICRKRVSHSSVKQIVPIVRNIIMKLMLNCRNKTLGCTAQFSVESSEAHMKECEYELVQCKNKPCKEKLFRKDIAEHEASDCSHRFVKCRKCGSKMPLPVPENHACIRALQLRLRRKNAIIRKKINRIKQLKNENKALKAASRTSAQSFSSRSFADLASAISPDDIMINITEYDSTSSSLSSDSEDSSENSIMFFASNRLEHSDNAESDSFDFGDNQDSIEHPRNESTDNSREYHHAESQTPVGDILWPYSFSVPRDSDVVADDPAEENAEIVPSRRPVKRRPTTQKPAKRRHPTLSTSSSDIGEPVQQSSSQSPMQCWRSTSTEASENFAANNSGSNVGSSLEAGPSSGASDGRTVNARSHLKLQSDQKRAKHANDADENDECAAGPSHNMFERTLALLEQYNLESDPEWIPEYASHRGDTTSESDSSEEVEFQTESSSELSDCDYNGENSSGNRAAGGDLVRWMFENSSEDEDDDPDWHPNMFIFKK